MSDEEISEAEALAMEEEITLEKARAKLIEKFYDVAPKDKELLNTVTEVDNYEVGAFTSMEVLNEQFPCKGAETFLNRAKLLKISLGREARKEGVQLTRPASELPAQQPERKKILGIF